MKYEKLLCDVAFRIFLLPLNKNDEEDESTFSAKNTRNAVKIEKAMNEKEKIIPILLLT